MANTAASTIDKAATIPSTPAATIQASRREQFLFRQGTPMKEGGGGSCDEDGGHHEARPVERARQITQDIKTAEEQLT
jgi:hypothetical protein